MNIKALNQCFFSLCILLLPTTVKGKLGRTGKDGPQGLQGPAGPPGEKGNRGSTGRNGSPGLQGAAGMIGQPGLEGAPGLSGSIRRFKKLPLSHFNAQKFSSPHDFNDIFRIGESN